MTVVNPPAWLQAGSYPAHTMRLVTSSIVETPGVAKAGDLTVAQSGTPGMSVVVSDGRAFIEDGSSGGDVNKGMYNFVNVGSVTLTVTAAHSTNYRVDRVVARVQDAEISGSVDTATLEVLAGTTSATLGGAQALIPAVPTGAINLASVTVGPSVSSITNANITNETATAKIYSDMAPGTVTATSSTLPTGTARRAGMTVFETDTQRTWRWSGSAWLFQNGKGPKAYVSRAGTWAMPTSPDRLSTLTPATGNGIGGNFETAYFTFVDEVTVGQGDRIRVIQAGLYVLEIFANMNYVTADYYATLRVDIASGSTGLPTGMGNFPSIKGKFPAGRAQHHVTRTVYLPAGMEIAYLYEGGNAGIDVDEFWASATLLG